MEKCSDVFVVIVGGFPAIMATAGIHELNWLIAGPLVGSHCKCYCAVSDIGMKNNNQNCNVMRTAGCRKKHLKNICQFPVFGWVATQVIGLGVAGIAAVDNRNLWLRLLKYFFVPDNSSPLNAKNIPKQLKILTGFSLRH